MTITVNLMQDLEQSVRRAARRAGVTPDAYVADVLRRHLQAETPMLPASESALLQQINIGLSEREWQRYHQLRNRLADETLTPDEQVELLDLTDRIETANVLTCSCTHSIGGDSEHKRRRAHRSVGHPARCVCLKDHSRRNKRSW